MSYWTARYLLMEEFGWSPEQVDAIDPVDFDRIFHAVNVRKDIQRRQYEAEQARMRK